MPATDAILSRRTWLICPDALRAMAAKAGMFEPTAELPNNPRSDLLHIDNGIGVVSVHGPMLRRPGIIESILFGATGTEELIAAVEEAGRREDVQALFLDIDSPGGAVNGTPKLAAAVADVSKRKYVYAFTAGEMCSAAYWVVSQADAIYATPSAIAVAVRYLVPAARYDEAGAVTDPATGLSFGYLRFSDTESNTIYVTVGCLYGFTVGRADGLKRLVKP